MVDEFHRVALENSGTDDGPQDVRPEYNPNNYGAFVRDPVGNQDRSRRARGAQGRLAGREEGLPGPLRTISTTR